MRQKPRSQQDTEAKNQDCDWWKQMYTLIQEKFEKVASSLNSWQYYLGD
jgi:hypothetical protein